MKNNDKGAPSMKILLSRSGVKWKAVEGQGFEEYVSTQTAHTYYRERSEVQSRNKMYDLYVTMGDSNGLYLIGYNLYNLKVQQYEEYYAAEQKTA